MQWKRLVKNNSPEPVLRVLRRARYDHLVKVSGFASAIGILGPEDIYDEHYYVKRQRDPWRSDANAVGEAILDRYDPDSVVDFGCAIGSHLEPFYEEGCRITGVEGNPKALRHAVVPSMHLETHDLREPYEPDERYDLVLCFEVAEHLPESSADTLVETLAGAGDTIVMTAATPGQRGTHHVNLKPRAYWREKFERREMAYDAEAVADLRNEIEVRETTWIPENLLVFSRPN